MIEHIVNSIFNSITYILPVGDQRDCWLVDCGDIDEIIDLGWQVKGVLLTHTHFDHIYGLNKLMNAFPKAVVYTNEVGKESLMNPKWNFSRYHDDVADYVFACPNKVRVIDQEGCLLLEDGNSLEVFFTPGHDPSCLSYRLGNDVFTGDAYIPSLKVVTSFPRSNKKVADESMCRLLAFERDGFVIRPGHWVEK